MRHLATFAIALTVFGGVCLDGVCLDGVCLDGVCLDGVCLDGASGLAADDKGRLAELDAYWAEVSRAVKEGDFSGYKETCHAEGVLVSGAKQTSQPLSAALARWKKDFVKTKAGEIKASVEFRFSKRLGDGTTAHETGIFRYRAVDSEGKGKDAYVHFEGLLVKKKGEWKILMEYQKSKATLAEWKALK